MNDFGEFLYKLRKEKNLTQSELADMLGITNKAVSKWESGAAFPETSQLVPIARIFGVSVDELLKGRRDLESEQHAERGKTVHAENNCGGDYFNCADKCIKKESKMSSREIALTGTGIAVILLGVFALIIMAVFEVAMPVYMTTLFVCLAAGVFLLIISGTDKITRIYDLTEEQIERYKLFNTVIGVSVAFLILSPLSIIVSDFYGMESKYYLLIFFGIIFVAVLTLVIAGMKEGNEKKSYVYKDREVEQAAVREEKASGHVGGIVMPLAVITYLILGFCYGMWHPGWIVFPIAGILTGLISTLIAAVKRSRS